MAEYKIKIKADNQALIFKKSAEGIEIIEAESAAEAKEKFKKKYENEFFLAEIRGVNLQITDVSKV